MNRKEGTIMGLVLLATFITGVFAVPEQQILNVFVKNFPESHLGQSTTNHVTLNCFAEGGPLLSASLDCKRVLPDGTANDFGIPPGAVLVVTDVSWEGQAFPEPTEEYPGEVGPGDTVILNIVTPLWSVFKASSTVDEFMKFVGSEQMTAGFVVSWVARMELTAGATRTALGRPALMSFGVEVLLHGYLKTGPQITPIP